jgi:hypothetical protein
MIFAWLRAEGRIGIYQVVEQVRVGGVGGAGGGLRLRQRQLHHRVLLRHRALRAGHRQLRRLSQRARRGDGRTRLRRQGLAAAVADPVVGVQGARRAAVGVGVHGIRGCVPRGEGLYPAGADCGGHRGHGPAVRGGGAFRAPAGRVPRGPGLSRALPAVRCGEPQSPRGGRRFGRRGSRRPLGVGG